MYDYDPDYIPTGPNNRDNPYYKTVNHSRIARQDSNRTEFLMGPAALSAPEQTSFPTVVAE